MCEIGWSEAVNIASQWYSVMTWYDPGVCMYAFSSTGKVQSEDHRRDIIDYIENNCLKIVEERDDEEREEHEEELMNLLEFIKEAPIEEVAT